MIRGRTIHVAAVRDDGSDRRKSRVRTPTQWPEHSEGSGIDIEDIVPELRYMTTEPPREGVRDRILGMTADGPRRFKDYEVLGHSPASLSKHLKRAVSNGALEKSAEIAEDGRAETRYHLTDAGKKEAARRYSRD